MVKVPVYTADENPEKREALRLFAKEGVVSTCRPCALFI